MWQRIEVRSKHTGESRYVEMNVFPKGDIMKYGLIWFPVTHYTDHRVLPILTINARETQDNAGSNKRRV
jgi:hypothetical protein